MSIDRLPAADFFFTISKTETYESWLDRNDCLISYIWFRFKINVKCTKSWIVIAFKFSALDN